ncbi:3'-5' exonuclease [Prevotella nigrescens]|jgi:3'-5' exonuclease|uniref:3'-5' exonuclease n=1 Tax=Prevotella nigrescens TaxID=28133 RepID=UPI001C5F68C7|nr:3'-5' exonuclease [Prevotella nigrescens]MBW4726122.1 3'-5' exonuclease domain-containing protein 2 [Prevotella nigrescens]
MITKLYNKFDKKSISDLPRVTFPGKIVVVLTESEAQKAVDFLLSADILGIDSETRPVFKKGQHHKVALLQVSTKDVCFLFRLNLIGMPSCIVRLLEDTTILKVGLSLHDDFMMLHQRRDFKIGRFIDLQNMVSEFGIEDLSLQKLYANLFHERITKRQQLSNWEAPILTEQQKIYAATDAWTCIQIYERLQELHKTHNYETVIVPQPKLKTTENIDETDVNDTQKND